MSDIVLTVPVGSAEEDRLFGRYLDRFLETAVSDPALDTPDAPFLMVRSDPSLGGTVKVVIFQESGAADAFSRGWSQTRRSLCGEGDEG